MNSDMLMQSTVVGRGGLDNLDHLCKPGLRSPLLLRHTSRASRHFETEHHLEVALHVFNRCSQDWGGIPD